METVKHIPITKAGKTATLAVDPTSFDDETYAAIFAEGLKACLNAKMSKVGAVTKLSGDELTKAQATAMSIAEQNLADLQAGKFKFPGAKAATAEPRVVQNKAVALARDVIRDQLKAAGITISHVPPKDITSAAQILVKKDPSYIAKAKELLAKAEETPSGAIDLEALGLRPDPKKVAAAEAAKVQRKENLSAAQAGRVKKSAGVATKSKPKASPADVIASMTGQGASQHPTANVVKH